LIMKNASVTPKQSKRIHRSKLQRYILTEKSKDCVQLPHNGKFNSVLRRFKIINIFFIILSILLIAPVYFLCKYDRAEENALIKYSSYSEVPTCLVFMALGVLFLTGCCGLYCCYIEEPYVLDSYEGLMLGVLFLHLIASIMAS